MELCTQRPGREDEQYAQERMALQYRRQKSAAGQAPHKESHRPVQHVQTASEPADENANGRSRKVDGITSSAHIIKSNNKRRRQKQPQQENKRVILQLEDNCQLTM